MKLKRKRFTGFRAVYPLTAASVDSVAARIQETLKAMKIERSNIVRIRLSIEEAMLRWMDHFGTDEEVSFEIDTHWGKPYIALRLRGESFDPLTQSENDLGGWSSNLLSSIGLAPVYRYVNGCNLVQLHIDPPRANPGLTLLIPALIGIIVGVVSIRVLDQPISVGFMTKILVPLENSFFRVLNAVSCPVLCLSVITSVLEVGSVTGFGRNGFRMVERFLIISTVFTLLMIIIGVPVFALNYSVVQLDGAQFSSVLDFFLHLIPNDILTPFIEGDFPQVILIALVIGNALLLAGSQAQTLIIIVEEANTVGLLIAEFISRMTPAFVVLILILGIHRATVGILLGMWKPLVIVVLFCVTALLIRMLILKARTGIPIRLLISKMKPSFLIALRTASVNASFGDNKNCCEKKLGISREMTEYGIPIGLLCFMPASAAASILFTLYMAKCYNMNVTWVWLIMALFLTVSLATASPPLAGVGILTYTALFSWLKIPSEALTIVLVGDIIMGFIVSPFNQAFLQLELVSEADRNKILNKKRLLSA